MSLVVDKTVALKDSISFIWLLTLVSESSMKDRFVGLTQVLTLLSVVLSMKKSRKQLEKNCKDSFFEIDCYLKLLKLPEQRTIAGKASLMLSK